jgi:hypothetical protein
MPGREGVRAGDAMMRFMALAILSVALGAAATPAATPAVENTARFDPLFHDRSLRLDYYHSGTRSEESASLDAFRLEPGGWAGSRVNLLDGLEWGKYRVTVKDAATGETLFTRSYSTLFGEWQTTDEAASGMKRTFHETVQIPLPRRPATITLASRRKDNSFTDLATFALDPASHTIGHAFPPADAVATDVEINGEVARSVDLLFVGDGYAASEAQKFRRDVRRFVERLFRFSPFKESRKRFNVRAVESWTPLSGVSEPRKGVWRDTPGGSSFNTFDVERYLTTTENRRLRDLATAAPYDRLLVMVNSSRYGGGGIHDFFAVFTSDNEYAGYVMVHEFGHAFAGLGDEYYTSEVAYNEFYPAGIEPYEPNISALLPGGRPKWEAQVTAGVPVPTPADPNLYAAAVGAFEGAGYAAKGLYRPALDCQMFSKGDAPFDPVCSHAIQQVIDALTE